MQMTRYALYFVPPAGGLAHAGAAWLGWDSATGQSVAQPEVAGLGPATEAPRKYGFHATLKAPFRLAEGVTRADLTEALVQVAAHLAPVEVAGLEVAAVAGSFLALRPEGSEADLRALCAAVVTRFEPFRAALTPEALARRRPETLTERQRDLLTAFGYPYVFEEFRFHMSLTGTLDAGMLAQIEPLARAWFAPHLPRPFRLDRLCLCGEDAAGRFHLLSSQALTG